MYRSPTPLHQFFWVFPVVRISKLLLWISTNLFFKNEFRFGKLVLKYAIFFFNVEMHVEIIFTWTIPIYINC